MKREEFGRYRDYGLFIDGAWRLAVDGGAREVIDPDHNAHQRTRDAWSGRRIDLRYSVGDWPKRCRKRRVK